MTEEEIYQFELLNNFDLELYEYAKEMSNYTCNNGPNLENLEKVTYKFYCKIPPMYYHFFIQNTPVVSFLF